MSKHRSRKTSKRRKSETSNNLSAFFDTILPFIDNLEKEDKLLLIIPEENKPQGIVIGNELSSILTRAYVDNMKMYADRFGGIEQFIMRRSKDNEFAEKYNPDQLLLHICRAARLVVSYRYGLQLGTHEFAANETSNNLNIEENSISMKVDDLPSFDAMPIFITMMGEESVPVFIGYELDGAITLEEYHENVKE